MKDLIISSILIALVVLFAPLSARTALIQTKSNQPLALVYRGPGACEAGQADGCAEAAANVAKSAGFKILFVGPDGKEAEGQWDTARLWIQPGGRVHTQVEAMTSSLKEKIIHFVNKGGGYVGFCAGMFLAAKTFTFPEMDSSGNITTYRADGLGFLSATAYLFDPSDESGQARIVEALWQGKKRFVYWEEGPYLEDSSLTSKVESVATYADNSVMTVRLKYGAGRVFVTGVHPEAPQGWYDYFHLRDADGLDHNLAAEMMKWAAPMAGNWP
jgi:glutamine amidotransferase-like uncharacterized protein